MRIYTFDHPPPHVHVAKAGAILKIDLAAHHVVEIVGTISDRDVKRAERRWLGTLTGCGRCGRHSMAVGEVSVRDRERFAAARERGRARVQDPSAVVGAEYIARHDVVALTFRSGGSMMIPRQLIPDLERVPLSGLRRITVSPAGDALSWPSLDIDVYVPGLVARAFGTRLFAAATGRQGGRRRSKTKAAAAKANGAKGGRPRKRLSA